MKSKSIKSQGIQRNKLLRYKAIQEAYLEHYSEDIPLTVIHRKYIYPKFFISKTTLYTILGTQIEKQLKALDNQP
ncbi:hypothetical protein [Flavobacterium psychrophilum]|uniref:hypothetical protein n=1 Tax=Flavobacterium psychrophilum TaxID=96345 RepID=UPI001D0913D9|nr:hypothetical protein [Flavobacterium psychrophilum]MCB6062521.1 hypothetical protein [Flavobacterium psychrophilum]MEB3378381.1 hypothetical protein [Flavobacterium psychrophilum]